MLQRHKETNNKFVETEAILQLEVDELRTECEQLRSQVKTETVKAKQMDDQLNAAITQLEHRVF